MSFAYCLSHLNPLFYATGLEDAFPAIQTLLDTAKRRGLIGTFTIDSSDYDPVRLERGARTPLCASQALPSCSFFFHVIANDSSYHQCRLQRA